MNVIFFQVLNIRKEIEQLCCIYLCFEEFMRENMIKLINVKKYSLKRLKEHFFGHKMKYLQKITLAANNNKNDTRHTDIFMQNICHILIL